MASALGGGIVKPKAENSVILSVNLFERPNVKQSFCARELVIGLDLSRNFRVVSPRDAKCWRLSERISELRERNRPSSIRQKEGRGWHHRRV